jgi:hypothetical protein
VLSDQDVPASAGQDALMRALSGLEDQESWALAGTPLFEGVGPMTAGRWGDTAWSGYLPDEMRVHVVGAQALLTAHVAMEVVGWSGSVAAYDRVVQGRWVRAPLQQVRAVDPDLLPAAAVAREFSDVRLGPGVVASVAGRRVVLAQDTTGADWQVGLDKLWASVSSWAGASYVLAPLDAPPQLEVPHDDDVIDAASIQAPPPVPRRRSGRHLPDVHALDDPEEPGIWSVRDPDLAELLGLPDSLALQAVVEAELRDRMPELSARVELDSERDCFCGYCRDEADARRLGDLLSDLARGRRG